MWIEFEVSSKRNNPKILWVNEILWKLVIILQKQLFRKTRQSLFYKQIQCSSTYSIMFGAKKATIASAEKLIPQVKTEILWE